MKKKLGQAKKFFPSGSNPNVLSFQRRKPKHVMDSPASWTLHIQGAVIDENVRNQYKFSDLFSKIVVQLDERLYPTNHMIEVSKTTK